jgi:hypothetical protein
MRAAAYITLAVAVATVAVAALTFLYRYTAVAAPLALAAGHRARYLAHGGDDDDDDAAKRSRSEPGGPHMNDVARVERILDLVMTHLDRTSIRNLALAARGYRDSPQRAPAELRARTPMLIVAHPSVKYAHHFRIAFSPGMDTVAIVDAPNPRNIRILDQKTGTAVKTLETPHISFNLNGIQSKMVVYDETGKHLAYINSAFVSIWDVASATERIIHYLGDHIPPQNTKRTAQFRGDTIMIMLPSNYIGKFDTVICNTEDEKAQPPRILRKNGQCLGPRENTLIYLTDDYLELRTLNYGSDTHSDTLIHEAAEVDNAHKWSHVTSTTDGRMVAAFKDTQQDPHEFSEPRYVYLFDLEANTHIWIDVTGDARNMMREVKLPGEVHDVDLDEDSDENLGEDYPTYLDEVPDEELYGLTEDLPLSDEQIRTVSHDGRIALVNHNSELTFKQEDGVYPGFRISKLLLSDDKQLLLVYVLDKLFNASTVILYDAQTGMRHKQYTTEQPGIKHLSLLGDREKGYHIHLVSSGRWARWDVLPLDRHVTSAWREELLQ